MNFMVYWEIWKSRINNTFGRDYLSQKIFVHVIRPLNSGFATESSELCTIHGITVRVNCEATVFGIDAGWIA